MYVRRCERHSQSAPTRSSSITEAVQRILAREADSTGKKVAGRATNCQPDHVDYKRCEWLRQGWPEQARTRAEQRAVIAAEERSKPAAYQPIHKLKERTDSVSTCAAT